MTDPTLQLQKKCTWCGISKPFHEFAKRTDKGSKSKLLSACRQCNREKSRQWRQKNPEKHREGIYKWRKKNPSKYKKIYRKYRSENKLRVSATRMVKTARKHAKKKNLPFNIDPEYVFKKLKDGYCEKTGIRFNFTSGTKNPCSPSIDKIVPAIGYVKGNVRCIVWALNLFKGEYSDNEIYPIAKAFCKSFELRKG